MLHEENKTESVAYDKVPFLCIDASFAGMIRKLSAGFAASGDLRRVNEKG